MTWFATIEIGDRAWLWPASIVAALTILTVWQAYRRTALTSRLRWAAMGLKAVGFLTLAICLVEPLWSAVRARPGSNIFVVLADNSQSLQIRDIAEGATRGEQMRQVLAMEQAGEPLSWQTRLAQDFDVRRAVIDSQLRDVDDFTGLTFEGSGSSLGAALRTIRQRYRGLPLGGVLLLTDGNATDGNATDGPITDLELKDLPPVYPVVIGQNRQPRDISIQNVAVSQTAFEDAPVTVQASLATHGFDRQPLVVRLLDESNEVVEQQTVQTDEPGKAVSVRFQHRPQKQGLSFYRLQVSDGEDVDDAESDAAAPDDAAFAGPGSDETSTEATIANNSQRLLVDRGDGPLRVLYVSGRPNWEFKFLRRALEEDDQIDLMGLIRVAKREPKFDWRGRDDETTNPLFRGFDKKDVELTERYDQPVLVRLNARDQNELRDGFPKSEDDLYGFSAVILDDLEAEFFTHDQMMLLQRFVAERGGGLLMLGGQESYVKGGYRKTPIGDMLPVYLDRMPGSVPEARYQLTLTRNGWLNPWVRLRSNEVDERQRLSEMSSFRTVNALSGVKPGATIMATVRTATGSEQPALIVQRYGEGRSAALAIGDFWRWQLRAKADEDDLAKAWRQTVRWLVADVPPQTDVQIQPLTDASNTSVRIAVHVRDKSFKPIENANVAVTITTPEGEEIALVAEPGLEATGTFDTVYLPRTAGGYRAKVTVTDENGDVIDNRTAGWISDPSIDEFKNTIPNRALMRLVAEATGGEVLHPDDLAKFVARLSTRDMPITERWTFPLWCQPWVFALAVGCLVGEWGLRRWKGLP